MSAIRAEIELDTTQRIDLLSGNVVLYIGSSDSEIEEVKSIVELISEEIEEMEDLNDFADAEDFKTEWIDETIKILSNYKKRVLDFKGETK